MIEIRKLGFSYDNHLVFQDLDINIIEGITGLIGINGAGKSTLVKLCVGLLFPDSGSVEINNFNTSTQRSEILKLIGVLFENPRFPPWAKVLDYLKWVGKLRNLSQLEAHSQSLLLIKKLGLDDKKDSYVNQLSAGLRQRFGLAQALIGIPKIIFLDEPSANLDIKYRNMVFRLIKEINQEFNTQFIILSHILSDLERFCDQIVILHNGKILFNNSVSTLLNSFTQRRFLLRTRNTNLLKFLEENPKMKKSVKIHEMSFNEVEIELSHGNEIDYVKSLLNSDDITILPKWSQLEEFFFEITKIHTEVVS